MWGLPARELEPAFYEKFTIHVQPHFFLVELEAVSFDRSFRKVRLCEAPPSFMSILSVKCVKCIILLSEDAILLLPSQHSLWVEKHGVILYLKMHVKSLLCTFNFLFWKVCLLICNLFCISTFLRRRVDFTDETSQKMPIGGDFLPNNIFKKTLLSLTLSFFQNTN